MCTSPVTKSAGGLNGRLISDREIKRLLWGSVLYLLLLPFRVLLGKKHPLPSSENRSRILRRLSGPIAHRGGQPENTLEAIRRSKAWGAVAVEIDVVMTKDGHAVLLHDANVNRTSNGSGFASDMTLEQLKKLDFGIRHSEEKHAGISATRIPTLIEAIQVAKELEMIVFLDIKDSQSVQTITRLFAMDPSLYCNTVVVSFLPSILHTLRQADADIQIGLTAYSKFCSTDSMGRPRWNSFWKHWLAMIIERPMFWVLMKWVWHHLGVAFMLAHWGDIVSGRFDVEKYQSRGIGVIAWTVNSRVGKDHFENVLHIPYMTDYILPT